MAVNMFLKVTSSSGDVAGESIDDKHKDEIEILAWNWGLSQTGSRQSGTGGGTSGVNVQDVSFTKYVDKATPTLLKLCCNGDNIPSVALTVRKAGGTEPVEYVKLTLEQCIVSSITSGGSGGGERITENVSFNFAIFKFEYTTQGDDQSGGASIPAGWNIATNKEVG